MSDKTPQSAFYVTKNMNLKEDSRPPRYSWAPGEYLCTCFSCQEYFAGDKRAGLCADCAYALPDPEPFNAAEMESTLTEAEYHLGRWESFGRAVAKEVGCLASMADPRPEAGNAHIISAIVALKNQIEAIKARNVINAIKQICPDCGHTLDENDECANCWKTSHEELHAEFGHIYAALTCFLKDWKDGDFTLPRLAEIHAEKLRELIAQ